MARARARPGRAKGGPARSVLGNDPFERGAAVRAVAAPVATAPSAPPEPEALPRTEAFRAASEVGNLLARAFPALRERLLGLVALLRPGEGPRGVDGYGMDRSLVERAEPLLDLLYLSWWRVETKGIDRVPARGPVVVVANHGGVAPWDALVLRMALRRDHPARRELRPLLEEPALGAHGLGLLLRRLGAVAATAENARRLLADGMALGVFPEGSAPRPWPQRYRIGAFGRGGFVKLALRSGAPIVPCAIVGSEEASPPVTRPGFFAELLKMPVLAGVAVPPIGAVGALPLPARWMLHFGEAVDTASLGAAAADDPGMVARLTDLTRDSLQALLDAGVAERRSIYL